MTTTEHDGRNSQRLRPHGPDDQLTFRCGPDLDCFTECCSDVSIVLTPYDVLRLKKALRMDSSEFLERHTLSPIRTETKVPGRVHADGARRPRSVRFVADQGCKVYAAPPLGVPHVPAGRGRTQRIRRPTTSRFYFVVHEELCHGHGQGKTCSVREWIEDQGIEPYEMMGRLRFAGTHAPSDVEPRAALTPEKPDMFYMACYDLDRFRRFVFETRFLRTVRGGRGERGGLRTRR